MWSIGKSRANPSSGYTLTELLVVLVIISLLMILVPSGLQAVLPGTRLEATARQVEAALEAARTDARASGTPITLSWNEDGTRLMRGERAVVTLPDGVEAEYRPRFSDAPGAEIRFEPSGATSGGDLTLKSRARNVALTLHWLTGRVERGS